MFLLVPSGLPAPRLVFGPNRPQPTFDHLGLPDAATSLHLPIEATTAAGVLTREVGGSVDTTPLAQNLSSQLG